MKRILLPAACLLALAGCGGASDEDGAAGMGANEAAGALDYGLDNASNAMDVTDTAADMDYVDPSRPGPPDRAGTGDWNRPKPPPGPKKP